MSRRRRSESDEEDLSVLFDSLAPDEGTPVKKPKPGEKILVTDKHGKWHEAKSEGAWTLEDGSFPAPYVVSLTVEAEGRSHFVECVPHRDFRPETSYTFWRWPHETA